MAMAELKLEHKQIVSFLPNKKLDSKLVYGFFFEQFLKKIIVNYDVFYVKVFGIRVSNKLKHEKTLLLS